MAGNGTQRLERIAAPLEPERTPYYVRHPAPPGLERQFPTEGWYWVPQGHTTAVFLAASYEVAAHELLSMRERLGQRETYLPRSPMA